MHYRFVAIDGNIAAGKTTLATKLWNDLGGHLICEKFDIPLLSEFYDEQHRNDDRSNHALQLELTFLTERHQQLKELVPRFEAAGVIVADYFIEKSLIFARATLNKQEFDLYSRVFEIVQADLPRPDIILYLQSDIPQLMDRIQRRGRSNEQRIEAKYLEDIQSGYEAHLKSLRDIPVLVIDTAMLEFVSRGNDYSKILGALRTRYEPGTTTPLR